MRGALFLSRVAGATLFTVAIAASAASQSPRASAASAESATNCQVTPAGPVQPFDLCEKVVDLFQFLAPQVGVALSGGNVMLGEGGTLGGPGKFSLSVRASLVDGRVPGKDVSLSIDGTATSSDFGAQRAPIPMPSIDAAIGVFRGYTVGLTNVGGVDLLLGATFVPSVNRDHVRIDTDGSSLAVSYGLRVGILQESAAVPGVAVSFKKRKLPTTSFSYTTSNDTLVVTKASLSSQALRLTVAKHFLFFGVGGGVGRDVIKSGSTFAAVINEPDPVGRNAISIPSAQQKVTRNTAFINLSFGLPKAQLTLEAGWSGKGDAVPTLNTFGGHSANEGYRYGSFGFGFRI